MIVAIAVEAIDTMACDPGGLPHHRDARAAHFKPMAFLPNRTALLPLLFYIQYRYHAHLEERISSYRSVESLEPARLIHVSRPSPVLSPELHPLPIKWYVHYRPPREYGRLLSEPEDSKHGW